MPEGTDKCASRLAALPPGIRFWQGRGPGDGGWAMLRRLVAGLLVALAAVLTPVAVGAVWTKQTVTDQDRYLAVVSGVSQEPQVRREFRDRVVAAILERVDLHGVAEALAERAVSGAVDTVFTHERFSEFWLGLHRVVHAQVTGVLTGDSEEFQLSEDGTLTMALGPLVEALAEQLEDRGVSLPPDLVGDQSVVLVRSADLVRVQEAYGRLVLAAAWLPLVCVVALCVGLLLVRRRAQGLMVAGLVAAAVSAALVVALRVLGGTLSGAVPGRLAERLLASLEPWLWTTAGIAAVVGLAAGTAAAVLRRERRA